MSQDTEEATIAATMWIGAPNTLDPSYAGFATFAVERTEPTEVAIHAMLPDDEQSTVSLYLSPAQATYLAALLNRTAIA